MLPVIIADIPALSLLGLALIFILLPLTLFYFAVQDIRSGNVVFVSEQAVFRNSIGGFGKAGEMISRRSVRGIEWLLMSNSGSFETRLPGSEEKEIVVAKGNAEGTLWVARLLSGLLGAPVTGNVPAPPVNDRKELRKVLRNTLNRYPGETEIFRGSGFPMHAPASLEVFTMDEMAGSGVTAGIPPDASDSVPRGLVALRKLGNARETLIWAIALPIATFILYSAWTNAPSSPRDMLTKYLFLFITPATLAAFLDSITGKVWLIFLSDRMIRKREWCGLRLSETLSYSDVAGIEMFRSVLGRGWEIKARHGNEKPKKTDIVEVAHTGDALWLASLLHKTTGAAIIERPNQRPETMTGSEAAVVDDTPPGCA